MKDKTKKRGSGQTPKLTEKEELRIKLRCTIEANRITRLKRDDQDEILAQYRERKRRATGFEKERLRIMVDVIKEKQRQADEAEANMTYAEYGGGFEGFGGGDGREAG